jgi:hypothetical protein
VRQILGILVAVVALGACTESIPSFPVPTGSPVADMKPAHCPQKASLTLLVRRNDIPGTTHRLVPGDPSEFVACSPSRRKAVASGTLAINIVDALNSLKLIKRGAVYNCPNDTGSSTYGLFFNYPNGGVLLVTLDASGCRFASNGQRFAFTSEAARKRVQRLLALQP